MAKNIVLRKDRKPRTPQQRNDYTPGYVYLMSDRNSRLIKCGLSRSPERRKWHLEKDYGNLCLSAKMWTFNMKWLESLMHKVFKGSNQHRVWHQSGYTEWFEGGMLQLTKMHMYLVALSLFVNGCYLLAGIAVLAVLAVILF